ncbi:protein EXORDIUM-like 3 [Nymphaea colorata]|nr:protein EXORDIUM-like 3 [Nymphaea colorata]
MGRQKPLFFPSLSVWLEMISLLMLLVLASVPVIRVQAWRPWPRLFNDSTSYPDPVFGSSKRYEGSSEFVHLQYHMGPVLTSNITIHTIWYGSWQPSQKRIIKGFLRSISSRDAQSPSVSEWWSTVQLYTDQTGSNISSNVLLGSEKNDRYSHGKSLTRLSIQSVIKGAITASTRPLPIDSRNGLYLVLTSPDVHMQDFCGQVCGFHYFTFPSIVGTTLPYAWVGNSAAQCPGVCAYPFAVPSYIPGLKPLNPPNGDAGVDGMISVIAHEIAELSTNPLVNAWYAGQDPSFPTEIADLCEGIYGTGGGGSYTGQLSVDKTGATYNMNGGRRRFLVQWVWNPVLNYCFGPNALDK